MEEFSRLVKMFLILKAVLGILKISLDLEKVDFARIMGELGVDVACHGKAE